MIPHLINKASNITFKGGNVAGNILSVAAGAVVGATGVSATGLTLSGILGAIGTAAATAGTAIVAVATAPVTIAVAGTVAAVAGGTALARHLNKKKDENDTTKNDG